MKIQTFSSIEDLFTHLDDQNVLAKKLAQEVPEEIRTLKPGDYGVCARVDLDMLIFIEVVDPSNPDEDDADLEANRENGFIFGRCYSVACPSGEYGDTHVTRINKKISEEVFLECKLQDFETQACVAILKKAGTRMKLKPVLQVSKRLGSNDR